MSKDASLNVATLPDDPALLKHVLCERERLFLEERRQRDALVARIREEAAAQLEASTLTKN